MKHLILFIDALGKSIINDQTLPRMHNFFRQATFTRVPTLLGYSNAIVPSIFSGVYPSEHQIWGLYKFSPTTTPFSFSKFLPSRLLDRNLLLRYAANKIIFQIAIRKGTVPAYMEPANVPIRILKYFDISMKGHITDKNCLGLTPTLFDHLRKNDIDFAYFGFPWHKGTENILDKARKSLEGNAKVVVAYIDEIDHSEHLYGVQSKQFLRDLGFFDDVCADFLTKSSELNDITITAFSDHGMRDVSSTDNVLSVIQALPLEIEKEYMIFLDSTIARFWFYTPKAKELIVNALSRTGKGHILSNEEIMKYNIDFDSDIYGHSVYLSDPGKIILPNFYTIRGGAVKAMHGWSPDDDLQDSFYFCNSTVDSDTLTDVTKIFYAIRKTIGF
jgi:hypothetical protein